MNALRASADRIPLALVPIFVHTNARRYGAVAQLGERVVRNDEVSGSIPLSSTIPMKIKDLATDFAWWKTRRHTTSTAAADTQRLPR